MENSINNQTQLKSLRSGFGEAVFELAKANRNILVLSADLSPSLRVDVVKKELPDQFIECGVAEQNMIGLATGLALSGKIPFATSFAEFIVGRAWEQIRLDVCYNNANVKIVGSHAGLATGEDGATHQILEDIALMRALPNMTILSPCDANETYQATIAASQIAGPVYIRLTRPETPILTDKNSPFEIGKIKMIKDGRERVIFSTGILLGEALAAARTLDKDGKATAVFNVSTLKPLSIEQVLGAIKKAEAVITVEDHQISGGLGSIIAEVVAENNLQKPFQRLGVNNSFGESGKYNKLWQKHGLDKSGIIKAVQALSAK